MGNKKYLLGSIIVILLMLGSTQLVFIRTVTSYPTIHYGDAYVGEFWISELDVSSDVEEFDYIGIAHARADPDWVAWDDGSGNISANWTVDIDSSNHPEYYIIYTLVVYNIDNESQELGNASFSQSFDENETYNESGTLTIPIQFTPEEMTVWEDVTLLCYLGALVQLNETEEAKNLSCTADDRSVVAVDFEMPMNEPSFGQYIDEANEEFPSMWSWIDGWEDHFEDEDEMLNEQTYFIVGSGQLLGGQQINNTWWYLGKMDVRIRPNGLLYRRNFNPGNSSVNWSLDDDEYAIGVSYMNYSVIDRDDYNNDFVRFRFKLFCSEPLLDEKAADAIHIWKDGDDKNGEFNARTKANNDTDRDHDGNISIWGIAWGTALLPCVPIFFCDYWIHIDPNVNQSTNSSPDDSYYWEESCAYSNETSESLEVSSDIQAGITTVCVDISYVLKNSDQTFYSFKADRGDTRVEFTC